MVSSCQVIVVFGSGEDWQCSNMSRKSEKREREREQEKREYLREARRETRDSKTREMSENKGRSKKIYQRRERIKGTIS